MRLFGEWVEKMCGDAGEALMEAYEEQRRWDLDELRGLEIAQQFGGVWVWSSSWEWAEGRWWELGDRYVRKPDDGPVDGMTR